MSVAKFQEASDSVDVPPCLRALEKVVPIVFKEHPYRPWYVATRIYWTKNRESPNRGRNPKENEITKELVSMLSIFR
jgi:hypothetical protein